MCCLMCSLQPEAHARFDSRHLQARQAQHHTAAKSLGQRWWGILAWSFTSKLRPQPPPPSLPIPVLNSILQVSPRHPARQSGIDYANSAHSPLPFPILHRILQFSPRHPATNQELIMQTPRTVPSLFPSPSSSPMHRTSQPIKQTTTTLSSYPLSSSPIHCTSYRSVDC
jgi:hypothetical protein